MGYSGDNKGLSKARNEAVTKYLVELGVNDSLIRSEQKYEMGSETIQQSARYVNVDIAYMVVNKDVTPSEVSKEPQIKKTYFLSKEKEKTHGHYKFKKKRFKLGKIKLFKGKPRTSAIDACPFQH